jgi:4-hydroxybenzoate polyprenyltransferase
MARNALPRMTVPDVPASPQVGASGRRSSAVALLVSLRPNQWTKNLLVFAPLVFAVKLFDPASVVRATFGFLVFCALSSVVYLINDCLDRDADRTHPLKRFRPIAAGDLSPAAALTTAAGLALVALVGAASLGWMFFLVAAGYVVLQTLYSVALKHVVILDALTLAIGFVLRAIGGAAVINVVVSHWLFVCTILGALFMALAKRRHELVLLADGAGTHRPILDEYSPYLLDQMIAVVTASTLISYVFYTISPETEQKFGTGWLGLTIPFALYWIFRYLYLVHRRDGGGSPTDLLLNDRPLLACMTLWVIAVVLIVYRPFVP